MLYLLSAVYPRLVEKNLTLAKSTMRAAWLTALAGVVFAGARVQAELPIDVEVVTDPGAALTAPQQWAKTLGDLQLGRIRLRGRRTGDQPQVRQVEGAGHTRFKVVAHLNSRGELVLPERRFRISDRKALERFFQDLAQQESFGEERGRFDLTEKQFRRMHADLSRVVNFSTEGNSLAKLLDRLEPNFRVAIHRDANAQTALQRSQPIDTELRGMTIGSALAIALRREGLVLRPEKPTGAPLRIVVEQHHPEVESWPIGWKHEGSPRTLAPQLFEFVTIEIDGYTLAQAIGALQPRLGVTIVYDERILAEREIQADKIAVKLPAGNTFLKKSVDRLLSQARLAGELRVDEQGRPFYWITQFGKDNPRVK